MYNVDNLYFSIAHFIFFLRSFYYYGLVILLNSMKLKKLDKTQIFINS